MSRYSGGINQGGGSDGGGFIYSGPFWDVTNPNDTVTMAFGEMWIIRLAAGDPKPVRHLPAATLADVGKRIHVFVTISGFPSPGVDGVEIVPNGTDLLIGVNATQVQSFQGRQYYVDQAGSWRAI